MVYCSFPNCKKKPSFNYPGTTWSKYCERHKTDTMIDVKHRVCEYEDCDITAIYNDRGSKRGKFCSKHKTECMINVVNKLCATPMCDTRVSPKYKGYCFGCFVQLFPDEKNARNYKTKEKLVADFVREQFSAYDAVFDKRVACGFSLHRPDILIDFGEKVIVIEIDENMHKEYDTSCENM